VPYTNYATPRPLKWIFYTIKKPPTWFKLNKAIKNKLIWEIEEHAVEDADIIFCTWWSVAMEVEKLPASKGLKYNLVQDLEFWNGFEDKVRASFSLKNMHYVAIAKHIQEYVSQYSSAPAYKIQVAIDENKYNMAVPITRRENDTVCMMYSEEPRKGSIYGLEAIKKVKEKVPSLKVTFFSTYKKPADLPAYISFVENPARLQDIYNNSAIFLGPSLQEGSALPPMEAMMCGCAIVCTDIEGHAEYAKQNDTAVMMPAKDIEAMCDIIVRLISNPAERIKLAEAGNVFIKNFSWAKSTESLVNIWQKALTNSTI
jgi:glycosyltransferase involved in cell wall biosynthesis